MVDLSPPLLLDKYYSQGERGEGDEFSLSSHFQPIYSLTHRRPVGCEGLIRAVHSASGRRVEARRGSASTANAGLCMFGTSNCSATRAAGCFSTSIRRSPRKVSGTRLSS